MLHLCCLRNHPSFCIQAAIVQRASFGAAPEAISVQSLRALVQYHLAAMSTDGYAVDFGDSHAQRGWDDTSTLQAALAARIVRGVPLNANPPAIDGCELRAFSASLYGSGGTYDDPWRLPPELLELNASGRVQDRKSVV